MFGGIGGALRSIGGLGSAGASGWLGRAAKAGPNAVRTLGNATGLNTAASRTGQIMRPLENTLGLQGVAASPYFAPAVGTAAGLMTGGLGYGALAGALASGVTTTAQGDAGSPAAWGRNALTGAAGGAAGTAAGFGLQGLMNPSVVAGESATPSYGALSGSSSLSGGTGAEALGGTATLGGVDSMALGGASSAGLTAGGSTLSNPYLAAGVLGTRGILSGLQAQEQKSATDPYARYSRNAMERLDQLAANPNQMYANDPGLRQIRKNALDAVTSRTLAETGGVEGGNYARQLMAESANIDRQNLMALANLEATIAGQAAPFAQANMEIGNPAYQGMNTVLSDQAFMSVLNGLLA